MPLVMSTIFFLCRKNHGKFTPFRSRRKPPPLRARTTVLRSLLIRASTPHSSPRAHVTDQSQLACATAVRYSLGFLLGLWLVVYWRSTGGLRLTPKGSYALRTSSTLLLLLKPWFSGNFHFHFTADGAPSRLDGHFRNFTPPPSGVPHVCTLPLTPPPLDRGG